jgi:predicted acylesterase/phospholipase RssA
MTDPAAVHEAPSAATTPEETLSVALSGGGHRAALFALGVLLYLVDSGLNRRVDQISSVSGGSITNGFVAQACDFREVDAEAFDRVAADLLDRIVNRGLFHGSVSVLAYLVLLAGGAVLGALMLVYGWPAPLSLTGAAVLAAALGGVALLRGTIVHAELSRRFFAPDGRPTKLSELARGVEHLFCSTDLRSNAPFYFSTWDGGYVYSPALGFSRLQGTRLEGTPLSTAVRASAAFPGGIPPKRVPLGDVHYEFTLTHVEARWQVTNTRHRKAGEYRPRFLFLADGGVWNNLGTQAFFEDDLYRGLSSWSGGLRGVRPPGARFLVVNASAPLPAARLWRLHVPLIGEITALGRSLGILNVNTVAPRVFRLRENPRCTVVSISDVRDRALERMSVQALRAAHPDDDELALYEQFGHELWHWPELRIMDTLAHEGLARASSGVRTTLGRIRRDDAIRLLVHAYQNTLAEVYAALPHPRPTPTPRLDRFERLLPLR